MADGVVYVGVYGMGANVYALDASTGAVLWSFSASADLCDYVYSSPAVANGVVYVGNLDRQRLCAERLHRR